MLKMIATAMLFTLLLACSHEQKTSGGRVVTVELQKPVSSLYYSGTVQPLKTQVVPCPADGVVVEMPVQYGEDVHAGQLLFMLSSAKFMTDYKSALTSYVKAKSQFNNSEIQLQEAEFLHKNQLISDDDYKSKQSGYYGAQLELLQARDSLENIMRQMGIKDSGLEKLSIADIDKITQALHLKKDAEAEDLRVIAPADGVLLAPGKNEEENKKTFKGDAVKQGDVLAVIGDMSGLSVRIKVNEMTINQLQPGQKVQVTGIAFPNYNLDGKIQRVDRQGETSSGGLPMFNVEVVVPALTDAQKKEIHAGMSAKVEIFTGDDRQLMVPINAVSEKDGRTTVKLYDEASGTARDALVQAGKTTTDSVAILSGLKPGDKIVVAD